MAGFSLNKEFEALGKQTIEHSQLNKPLAKNKMHESARNQYFFQDSNAIRESNNNNKPHSKTRIKSRNFLSNTFYVGVTKQIFIMKILFLTLMP